MKYKFVIYQKDGAIARITLNRPDKLNVIDFPGDGGILDELDSALDEAADDDDLKVLIIRGAGRAFCAGHDLDRIYKIYEEKDKEPGKRRPSQRARLHIDRKWLSVHQKILLFPRVTIAQVHGHCIGEGAAISESCDISIVAENAQISHAEQRLGFSGSGINLVPLFQHVGYKKARWMCLLGEAMDGKEAERIGWASKAVPQEKLEEEVEATARKVCLLPKDGIAIGKASNHQILDILGTTKGWSQSYVSHTLFTNVRYEDGEWIFVKDRKQKGAKAGFHARDDRYRSV